MKKVKFGKNHAEISNEEFSKNVFSINFNGDMLIEFTKQNNGKIIATNGVNGWGSNIQQEVQDIELELKDDE